MGEFICFHDIVLYRNSDLKNLEACSWLNDTCLNFILRYIEKCVLRDVSEGRDFSSICFMDCNVLSCLMLSVDDEDELKSLAAGLDISSKTLIFAPVNDNVSFSSSSNHWSLLVVSVVKDKVYYLHADSNTRFNYHAAERAAVQLHKLLGRNDIPFVHQLDGTPQQMNAYDCGMYCALNARDIAVFAITRDGIPAVTFDDIPAIERKLSNTLTPSAVTEARAQMLKIAQSLFMK